MKIVRHFYLIEKEHLRSATFGGAGVEGVLDMLRYDGALVESNAPAGYWLLSAESHPEVARWRSFGIKIILAPLCRDAFDVQEFLRKNRPAQATLDPRDG